MIRKLVLILILVNSGTLTAQKNAEPYDKGEYRLKIAFPYFNYLTINPIDETRSCKFGFLGESLGIEYSVSSDRFLELNMTLALTSKNPLPFPFDRAGPYHVLSTRYISTTYNFVFGRFTVGTGINCAHNLISRGSRSLGDTLTPHYSDNRENYAIGLTANGYYSIGKTFNVGLIYRPTFCNLKQTLSFNYDHLLSIEFNWRIRLNNK